MKQNSSPSLPLEEIRPFAYLLFTVKWSLPNFHLYRFLKNFLFLFLRKSIPDISMEKYLCTSDFRKILHEDLTDGDDDFSLLDTLEKSMILVH